MIERAPVNHHSAQSQKEIHNLHSEITQYISVLNNKIQTGESVLSTLEENTWLKQISPKAQLQKKVDIWMEKKNVLEAALLCLAGQMNFETFNTIEIFNTRYSDGMFSITLDFINRMKKIKLQHDKKFAAAISKDHFSLLPSELILALLVNHLDNFIDIFNVVMTSRGHYKLFQDNAVTVLLSPFMDQALLGNWNGLKNIWHRYPKILERKYSISQPGRYKYNNTAFQIAWMNEEYHVVQDMQLCLSSEKQKQQLKEALPTNRLDRSDLNLKEANTLLMDVIHAITQDHSINENDLNAMNENTKDKLSKLYDFINPDRFKANQSGLVFETKFYLAALHLFELNYFQLSNNHRRLFWCVRVEEAIATCLPTALLRDHCYGIRYASEKKQSSDHSSYYRKGFSPLLFQGGSSFSEDKTLPGVGFFINHLGEQERRWARGPHWLDVSYYQIFKYLVHKNNEEASKAVTKLKKGFI